MSVIGLTGGIATGKSTVSAQLVARGIPVIDADVLAREVVRPGTRALKKIVSTFGPEILQEDGTLNRTKLGEIVFRDEEQRRKLNAIVHPAVRWGMALGVLKCWLRGERVCVLDVPLLIESKIHQWVGKVVVVYCSAEIQLQRLVHRDNTLTLVLENSGTKAELEVQVDAFVRRLYLDARWSWRLKWLIPPLGLFSAMSTLLWRRVK
ncbi:CoaE-domain-containing protein [Lactarius sanguifluus]|nr:CoaE-domain-containing protein [Lactarius sanguifluus]